MGPCRSYRRDKNLFYNYRDDDDDYDREENKDEAKRPMPSKEELKGALKCINPKYREEEIESILEYALRSQTISDIILRCATEQGFKEKFPSSIQTTTNRY